MTRKELLSEICPVDCIRDDICEVHDCSDICYPLLNKILDKHDKQIRADAIEEFAHALKETFNNEFPSNYHCTKPYFTLDNVRVLVDLVAKEQKNG